MCALSLHLLGKYSSLEMKDYGKEKKMVVVDPEKIEWEPVEQLKGAWDKVLSLDEETGAMAGLIKLDKSFHEPKHIHPSDYYAIVLEGKVVDEKENKIKRGMYIFIPAGVEHGVLDVPEGCVLFIQRNGPA